MYNILTVQDSNSLVDNFNIDLHVKNMHLWHGFVVTPGVMMTSSMEYQSTILFGGAGDYVSGEGIPETGVGALQIDLMLF